MNLKRVLITASLLAACFVTGCQKKSNDYFKQYSFTAKATTEQLENINKGIESSGKAVSKVIKEYKHCVDYALLGAKESYSTTTLILDDTTNKDLLIFKSTSDVDSVNKEEGLEFKENRKEERQEWDTGVGYAVISTDVTINKVTENRTQAYELDKATSGESKKNRILTMMELTDVSRKIKVINPSVYQNKDGSFTYIEENDVTKTISSVDLGKSTKELVKETRKQIVYTISKDYRFTSYYSYQEESTNRDPMTNEWYDKVKVVSYSYTSLEFEYGARETASVKELTNKAVAKKDILVSRAVRTYETTAQDSAGTYYIPENPLETEENANITSITEDFNGYKIVFNSNLYSGASYSGDFPRAQRFELLITSISKDNQVKTNVYPINYKENIITNSVIEKDNYSVITANENTYFSHSVSGTTYTLIFTIEFTHQKAYVESLEIR